LNSFQSSITAMEGHSGRSELEENSQFNNIIRKYRPRANDIRCADNCFVLYGSLLLPIHRGAILDISAKGL
jgi:hypothetical protein